MVHQLSLDSLKELDDGRLIVAWQQALKRAALDCEDRPGEEKPRVVSLQCELLPLLDSEGSGQLESIKVTFQVADKAPPRKSKPYDMALRRGGVLVFNDMSEDDIHPKTIDEKETN